MKKLIILIILIFTSIKPEATEIEDARKNLGYELNQTVNILKGYFRDAKSSLENNLSAINEINTQVEALSEKSTSKESNYTVLPHGKAQIEVCQDDEELRWNDSQWKCEKPGYISDCDPAAGEAKIRIKDGGYTCRQNGEFSENDLGFGVCNNNNGEKQTQVECLFTNNATNNSYQVEDSNCAPSKIQRYKQACGPNGDKSSCKCPEGTFYTYIDGQAKCGVSETFRAVTNKSASVRSSLGKFWPGMFNRIFIVPDGNHIELMVRIYHPSWYSEYANKAVNWGHYKITTYSSEWLKSKNLPYADTPYGYARIARFSVDKNVDKITKATFKHYTGTGIGTCWENGTSSSPISATAKISDANYAYSDGGRPAKIYRDSGYQTIAYCWRLNVNYTKLNIFIKNLTIDASTTKYIDPPTCKI